MDKPRLPRLLQRAHPVSTYVAVLLRWLWLIVLCAVVAGGAAYILSTLQHPVYRANALLVVDESHSGQDVYNSFLASEQFATLYTQLATQPVVLTQAARGLGDISAGILAAQISAATVNGSPVFQIQADASSPEQAARMANGVASALVAVINEQGPGNTNIVRIFQPALPPSAPDHPKALTNAAVGAALGLAFAAIFALLVEALRERVRTAEQIEQATGLPTIGAVPDLGTADPIAAWRDDAHLRESFRMLRANLYSHPPHAVREHALRVLAVTSAEPGEGKTLVATELAIALARSGKRVLLIDCDLHHPSVHECLGLPLSSGLAAYLEGEDLEPRLETLTDVPRLWVLPAGAAAEHTTESLSGQRMRLLLHHPLDPTLPALDPTLAAEARTSRRRRPEPVTPARKRAQPRNPDEAEALIEVIILDTPPLLASADAAILSTEADGVLVVADTVRTRTSALNDAQEVLRRVGARVLGVVLNRASDQRSREYYRVGARSRAVATVTAEAESLSQTAD